MSLGCNKLTRKNVEKLLASTVVITNENGQTVEVDNITSPNDIQLYIELSKRQDCLGRVEYVSYKEFMEILDCSKATFYNSLGRLEKLGYIRTESDRKGFWDIVVLNNTFLTEKDYKQGYMRTNIDFFYSSQFKKMSLVEKKVCIYLHLNKNKFNTLEVYLETLLKSIGIKIKSVVKAALDSIKHIFPHSKVNGSQGEKIVFGSSNVSKNEQTENANYIKHKLKAFCDRYKVKHQDSDIEDVSILSGQYCKRLSYNHFMRIVIHVMFESTIDKSLNPEYINHLCKLESKRKFYNT